MRFTFVLVEPQMLKFNTNSFYGEIFDLFLGGEQAARAWFVLHRCACSWFCVWTFPRNLHTLVEMIHPVVAATPLLANLFIISTVLTKISTFYISANCLSVSIPDDLRAFCCPTLGNFVYECVPWHPSRVPDSLGKLTLLNFSAN